MNKLVVAAAALLAILLLGVPPALGTLTEARVRGRVASLNSNGVLSAEVKSFDRGWFGSSAKIELGLTPAYRARLGATAGDLGQRTTIAVDFAHGPIAVLDGVHFGWSKMVAHLDPDLPGLADVEQQLGVPYLFEFRGLTGFLGDLRFDGDVPPIDLPVGGARLKFAGAFLKGTYTRARLISMTRIESVEFSSPVGTFSLHNMFATTDNELRSQYVMPGQARFSIENVAVVDALQTATPRFEVSNLNAASTVSLDASGALLDVQTTYGLDRMLIEDSEVTAATIGLALHKLDVDAIEAYSAAARDFAIAGGDDPGAMLASLAPQIERALAAGPSLMLDPIRLQLDGEPFEGHVEFLTNTARLPPAGALSLDNPLLLFGLFNSNAELRLSKPLARRVAAVVAQMQLGGDGSMPPDQLKYMAEAQAGLLLVMLVGQGVLVEDDDGYRATARLEDGALTLNGNPLPFGLP